MAASALAAEPKQRKLPPSQRKIKQPKRPLGSRASTLSLFFACAPGTTGLKERDPSDAGSGAARSTRSTDRARSTASAAARSPAAIATPWDSHARADAEKSLTLARPPSTDGDKRPGGPRRASREEEIARAAVKALEEERARTRATKKEARDERKARRKSGGSDAGSAHSRESNRSDRDFPPQAPPKNRRNSFTSSTGSSKAASANPASRSPPKITPPKLIPSAPSLPKPQSNGAATNAASKATALLKAVRRTRSDISESIGGKRPLDASQRGAATSDDESTTPGEGLEDRQSEQ